MSSRWAFPVAWLLLSVALLQVSAGGGASATVALVASALLCGVVAQLVARHLPTPARVELGSTAGRRLHGRFLQQSRPGVPGRIRSRAPGSRY